MPGATSPSGPRVGKRIAILGEMLELGDQATAEHRALGEFAAAQGIDYVVAVGGDMAKQVALAAAAAGASAAIVADNPTAAALVNPMLEPGDVVLVKGSRSGARWEIAQLLAGQEVSAWGDWH